MSHTTSGPQRRTPAHQRRDSRPVCRWLGALLVSAWAWSQPALAQSTTDGGGSNGGQVVTGGMIADAVVDALRSLLRTLFTPIEGLIEAHGNSLLRLIVGTPHPETVLDAPRTLPWVTLHEFYWSTIIPLSLLLFGLAVGLVILLETTSHLFSSYHRTNLKRRAFSGLLGILSWWWLAALSLQVTDQLVTLLVPDLASISLFETVSFAGIGLLGIVVSLSLDALIFGLLALVYLGRQLLLYSFVLGMPLLIAAWIPGVGPFALIARFATRLAGFYVPFLLMPVPVALLLRLGALLGDAATLSMGGLGAWLTALVIPFVAIASPFVLIWQASGLLFVGERLGRRLSGSRLRSRTTRGRDLGTTLATQGRESLHTLRDRSHQPSTTSEGARSGSRRGGVRRGLHSAAGRLGDQFQPTDTDDTAHVYTDPVRFEPTEYDTATHDESAARDETPTDDRTDR
ncbi:hypothetical protein [Haloplanus sp. C73]|uniref:hypothetical protein n=1 Tax=Haloplanus sp. C73 TaxID=3421641 RepID=UPI003EB7E80B